MTRFDRFLVQGDVGRQVFATLTDGNGDPVDLSAGSPSVKYILWGEGATVAKVNATATIVTPAGGVVRYDYLTADIDTPGPYLEEWQVTAGGNVVTYPEVGPNRVLVREQMGS